MVTDTELREHLIEVLQRTRSVEDFSEWLSVATVNMHRDSTLGAQRLAGSLLTLIYEYLAGDLSEAATVQELAAVADNVRVQLVGDPSRPEPWTASTAVSIQPREVLVAT